MMMKTEEDSDQGANLKAGPDSDFTVHCSICLELVDTDGSRSKAKLQCGHEFHLDCIGSAFNVQGIMQCPNCRNVEKGQWMYAIGSANLAEQYPFFLVPYGFRICPFRGFTEMDNPIIAGHAFYGNHGNFSEQMLPSSPGVAYIAYFGPHPHASLNPNDHRNRDGSHMIARSHQSTLNSRTTGGEPDAVTGSRFSGHPFSSSQRPRFFTPIAVNQIPYSSVYAFGGIQSPHPFNYHHPRMGTSLPFPLGVRRSNSLRGFPALSPAGRPSGPRATFYHPPYPSTGYNLQAIETPIPNYSHPWGRGFHFPVPPFAHESDQWLRHRQ